MITNHNKTNEWLWHVIYVSGTCCPDCCTSHDCQNNDYCGTCSSAPTCHQGFHIDVRYFNLLSVKIPNAVFEKYLHATILKVLWLFTKRCYNTPAAREYYSVSLSFCRFVFQSVCLSIKVCSANFYFFRVSVSFGSALCSICNGILIIIRTFFIYLCFCLFARFQIQMIKIWSNFICSILLWWTYCQVVRLEWCLGSYLIYL